MHDTLIINIPIQPMYAQHLGGTEFGIVGDLHMYGIRAEGEVRFDPVTGETSTHNLKHPFEKLPSSYAHMAVKFYNHTKNCTPYVSLNASPKFLQGHNICGVESIEQLVFEMLGTLKDTYPAFYLFLDIANAHISRVDFTYSTRLLHDDLMPNVIDMIGRVSVGQRKPDPKRNKFATTRYWGKADNRNGYCKIYGKDDEVSSEIRSLQRKARAGNSQATNLLNGVFTQDIQDYSKNLLRFEATSKQQELKDQNIPSNLWQFILHQRVNPDVGIKLWNKWFSPILDSMQGEIMTNIDDSEVLALCKDKLFTITAKGNKTYTKAMNAYRFYCFLKDKGFVHAKSVTDVRTFQRNIKSLNEIGIPKSHLQNLNGRENKTIALVELVKFDFSNQAPPSYRSPVSRYHGEFDKYLNPLRFVA